MDARSIIEQGKAINQSQAMDRTRSIPYRPQFTLITGKPASAILLQQIRYWWHVNGRKPFYKFRDKCGHDRYKPGDSWCEELGFTQSIFDTALKAFATKITKGVSKSKALRESIVIFWTDSNRMTWYQVNESLLGVYVYLAYNEPTLLGNLESPIYLDESENPYYLDELGKPIYLSSETTPQTTSEKTPTKEKGVFPEQEQDDVFPPPRERARSSLSEVGSLPKTSDPLEFAAGLPCANGKASTTIPAEAGGEDVYAGDPLLATCALVRIGVETLDKEERKDWARKLRKITESVKDGTPALLIKAIRAWKDHGPAWKGQTGPPYPNPFSKAFHEDITNLMRQLLSGTIKGVQATGPPGRPKGPIIVTVPEPTWLRGPTDATSKATE